MNRILVSFCNVLPGGPVLALLDPETLAPEVIELPDGLRELGGFWGLALSPTHLFATTTRLRAASPGAPYDRSHLLVFDRERLTLASDYRFQLGQDVHSLHFSDGVLYAVSTGTDEVLALTIQGGAVSGEKVAWRPDPDGPREDRHHLNGITTLNGELVVSGFGRKDGVLWASAGNGFVASLATGTIVVSDLRHPHSPIGLGADLAYCDSATGTFRIAGTDRARELSGYARGSCLLDDSLFVGTSLGRRVSRSSGVMTSRGEPGETVGRCAISRLSRVDLAIEQDVDLTGIAQEVYEITALDGTDAWPRANDLEWCQRALRGARRAYEEAYAGLVWLHSEVAKRDQAFEALREEAASLHRIVAEHAKTIEWLHREVAIRDAKVVELAAGAERAAERERTGGR